MESSILLFGHELYVVICMRNILLIFMMKCPFLTRNIPLETTSVFGKVCMVTMAKTSRKLLMLNSKLTIPIRNKLEKILRIFFCLHYSVKSGKIEVIDGNV